MSDHLVTLFRESMILKPKLIVELGILTGESTFVLERVAKLNSSKFVSVDITDFSRVCSYEDWSFIHKSDVDFAKEFKEWCKKKKIKSEIDILFIDTSHMYAHTKEEIRLWFPFLSKKGKVIFHDTNLKRTYFRKDGSMGLGFANKRGVIRGLENYFGKKFNEKSSFIDYQKGWFIKHLPNSNGLTILERM